MDPPVADFTGTPLTGTAPLSVTFTDASTNTPTSWLWEKNSGSGWVNFADTPTAQNPTESFAAGTWSVRLTATNAGGSDTKTRTNYLVSTAITTITTTGDGTFTPTFTGDALVECWGAGGSSVTTSTNERSGGGSAGGWYASSVLSLKNGVGVSYHNGAAAANTAGEATWFSATGTLQAPGGRASATNSGGGSNAGNGTAAGTTTRAGGAGGGGATTHPNKGGGGGSSAGTASVGNAGVSGNAGGAGTGGAAVTGGGAGGDGGQTTGAVGNNGTAPGGGSGGGATRLAQPSAAGGIGGNGQIRITYPAP